MRNAGLLRASGATDGVKLPDARQEAALTRAPPSARWPPPGTFPDICSLKTQDSLLCHLHALAQEMMCRARKHASIRAIWNGAACRRAFATLNSTAAWAGGSWGICAARQTGLAAARFSEATHQSADQWRAAGRQVLQVGMHSHHGPTYSPTGLFCRTPCCRKIVLLHTERHANRI